jgi:hypothetical protein
VTSNRGVWRIDEEQIARALHLPPGQRVTSIQADWPTLSIDVMIEGEGLPEVEPAMEPRIVGRGLPALDLRRRLVELVEDLRNAALDHDNAAYGKAADRLQELLR